MSQENPYASPTADSVLRPARPAAAPPKSVTFKLTEDEVLAVISYINRTNRTYTRYLRGRQRVYLIIAAASAVISLLFAANFELSHPMCVIPAVMSATCCLAAFRLPARSRQISKKLAKEMLANEGAQLLDRKIRATLFEDGVELADQDGHSFRNWSAVPRVDRNNNMLLIFMGPSSAQGVPSRAFFDEADFESYCQLAERLWRQAHLERVQSAASSSA